MSQNDTTVRREPRPRALLAEDMLAALKAIRRWCDYNDHNSDAADKVRNIRLVADDYLKRAGIVDWKIRTKRGTADYVE